MKRKSQNKYSQGILRFKYKKLNNTLNYITNREINWKGLSHRYRREANNRKIKIERELFIVYTQSTSMGYNVLGNNLTLKFVFKAITLCIKEMGNY